MCPTVGTSSSNQANSAVPRDNKSPYFECRRLNSSTFVIVEHDEWNEEPYIYVKLYTDCVVLIDTGCGGAPKADASGTIMLREFLETFPVPENDNQPLNTRSSKPYVVVCTHCHFDHIGAAEQFMDNRSTIWAGSYDKSFLDKSQLSTTSLCELMELKTPNYTVHAWAEDGQRLIYNNFDLDLVVYHTPGHTPDQIAIWDSKERVLFVGDTLYERVRIVIPLEGNLRLYSHTLGRLKTIVQQWNSTRTGQDVSNLPRVKMACGHETSAADAEELIESVDSLLYLAVEDKAHRKDWGTERGEEQVSYYSDDRRFNMYGPKRYFDELREDGEAMRILKDRQSGYK